MTIDIYILKRGIPTQLIHQLKHEQCQLLRPTFSYLWRETGVDIDMYSDARIATGLPELCHSLTDACQEENNPAIRKEIEVLLSILEKPCKQRLAVGFFGKLVLSSRSSKENYATT